MPSNYAKILKHKVDKLLVEIHSKKKQSMQLKVELAANINPPKEKEDKTALLDVTLKLTTPKEKLFHMEIQSEFIFEFDSAPADYDKAATDLCIPLAQPVLYQLVDDTLQNMGYPKLDLAQRIPLEDA